MIPARRFLAALLLGAWVLASGHVAIKHGVAMDAGCVATSHAHENDAHSHDHGDGEHHHHLTAVASSPLAKVLQVKEPVLWLSLERLWTDRLLETLRAVSAAEAEPASWESPPDERAAGWLLLCHTARPVRGPSLGA